MSDDPTIESVVGMVHDQNSVTAQLAWMIRFISNSVPDEALDDQRLLQALQSEDDRVRNVASWVYEWIENVSLSRAQQQLGVPVQ
jgi:HEAT repeat protein